MLGFDTVLVVQPDQPNYKESEFVAPALDCVALQETATLPGVRIERKMTSLVEVEPPDSMFDVPIGYVEKSPAQVEDAYQLKFGKSYWGKGKMLALMEQRYFKSRE